jgi:hypothetical protein
MPPKRTRTAAERERQLCAAREKALYTRRLKQSRRLRGELAAVDAHIATYETELGTQPEAPAEPSYRGPAASAPTAVPPPAPAPTPGVSAPPPPTAAPAPPATALAPPCSPTASVASPSASGLSDAESVYLSGEDTASVVRRLPAIVRQGSRASPCMAHCEPEGMWRVRPSATDAHRTRSDQPALVLRSSAATWAAQLRPPRAVVAASWWAASN